MKKSCNVQKKEKRLRGGFLLAVFLFFFLWSCTQRFNFSSDEEMRYQIPQYIYEHGSLPRGDDPEVRNPDWGISYAFNPILSYIGSAVCMKAVSLFSTDPWILLLAARFMNVLLGTLTAFFVWKAAETLFSEKYAWMFTFLVMFLPSNVVIYSYVNCDALAMCSASLIFWAWAEALQNGWQWKTCIRLAVGMGICLLSYYNAYGYVLLSFFFFVSSVLLNNEKSWKELLSKGMVIAVITCALALWWFIRNGILYDGDLFARRASKECAEQYARWNFKPSHIKTFQENGRNMIELMFYRPTFLEHTWLLTVIFSFVGAFGYNKIYLSKMIILPYLLFLTVSLLFMLVYRRDDFYIRKEFLLQKKQIGNKILRIRMTCRSGKWKRKGMFSWTLVLAAVIPNFLNVYYSYTTDFQAQGRYSLPMLFPLMYFVTVGCLRFFEEHEKLRKFETGFCCLVCLGAFGMAVFSWGRIIVPLFLQGYSGLN